MPSDFKQILTIDVEDWFHCLEMNPDKWSGFERRIEIGIIILLRLLDDSNSKATFFVLGEVAQNNPEIVSMIMDRGHEIGSHGMFHQFAYNQNKGEFERDLNESIELLSRLSGKDILSYRAPYFSITRKSFWALEILKKNGIKYDSSIFPVKNHRYGIPDFQRTPHEIIEGLWEWPITTLPTVVGNFPFAGGVYLRFLPISILRKIKNHIRKRNEPLLLYIHPWEFDIEQPVLKSVSWFLKLRHYYSLDKTEDKVKSILDDAASCTISEYFQTNKVSNNAIGR